MPKKEDRSPKNEEQAEQAEALRNTVRSAMDVMSQFLSAPMMGLIADEMGLTKDDDEAWDIFRFAEAMGNQDRSNAHERAKLVNSVFGDIFEELSELSVDQLVEHAQVIDLLRTAYNEVMLPLQRAGAHGIEELFCESHPFSPANIPFFC